ncbi:ATP-binding protein [Sphaerimonospora mesophila]|uniref:ATP-binding protein n=1 Tax=Sphaerimonospora mesophila TaxID=37483 RepID=UPI003D71CC5C
MRLPEGSKLVLYTDGLLADDPDDPRPGMERLRAALGSCGRSAEEACASALTVLPPGRRSDDVVLLVARTRALPADHVACWDLSVDPAAVSRVRTEVARRLSAWNLDELGFTTELIFSELVTNAIRYGSEPISARLLLDRKLICEVSDASETSPRPRRAAITDEGGRGLFLVAQLAERWGTRYTQRGKIIWAEQFLEGEPAGQLQAHEKP